MEPLTNFVEDGTFTYTRVKRAGMRAIYEQKHKASGALRYEVIRIQTYAEHTWPTGQTTPSHEAYPSAKAWGRDGFTTYTLKEAEVLFAQLPGRQPGEPA